MIPQVILSRIAKLVLLLFAALVFGVIYSLVTHDRIMLLLTLVLAIAGGTKVLFLLRSVRKREYTTVEGTLISARRLPVRKCQILTISDGDGRETEICVKGHAPVMAGRRYRLYLSQEDPITEQLPQEVRRLGTARTLLGYEEVGI